MTDQTVASDDPTGRAARQQVRTILEEAYDAIDPQVDSRHDGAVADLAAAGLLAAAPAPAWDTRATVPDVEDLTARLAAADVAWGREVGDGPSSPNYISFLARQAVAFAPVAAPAPNGDVYVHLVSDRPASARQREVSPGVVLDFDEHGRPIGVEVLGATSVEMDGSPVAVPAAQPDDEAAVERIRTALLGAAVMSVPPKTSEERDKRLDAMARAALAALRGKQK